MTVTREWFLGIHPDAPLDSTSLGGVSFRRFVDASSKAVCGEVRTLSDDEVSRALVKAVGRSVRRGRGVFQTDALPAEPDDVPLVRVLVALPLNAEPLRSLVQRHPDWRRPEHVATLPVVAARFE